MPCHDLSYHHRLAEHEHYCKRIEELEKQLDTSTAISNDYKDKWHRALEEIARLKAANAGAHMDEMVRR